MKKTEKVAIAVEVIIDNSGSMRCIAGQVVEGINKFIEELSTAIFPARLGVTLFDDTLRKTLIDGVSVAEQPRVRRDDYNPDHGTENIAHSVIQALDERLAPVAADQKVLVVLTDGLNKSPEMARAKALIAKRRGEGWLIVWLGVYIKEYEHIYGYKKNLLAYAKGLGIPEGLTFALPTSKIREAMPLAASVTLRFFNSGGKDAKFTDEERAIANA